MNTLRYSYIDKYGFIEAIEDTPDFKKYLKDYLKDGDFIFIEEKNKYFQKVGGKYNPTEVDREVISIQIDDSTEYKLVEVDPMGSEFLSEIYRDRFKFRNCNLIDLTTNAISDEENVNHKVSETLRKNKMESTYGLISQLYPYDINIDENSFGSCIYDTIITDFNRIKFPDNDHYCNRVNGLVDSIKIRNKTSSISSCTLFMFNYLNDESLENETNKFMTNNGFTKVVDDNNFRVGFKNNLLALSPLSINDNKYETLLVDLVFDSRIDISLDKIIFGNKDTAIPKDGLVITTNAHEYGNENNYLNPIILKNTKNNLTPNLNRHELRIALNRPKNNTILNTDNISGSEVKIPLNITLRFNNSFTITEIGKETLEGTFYGEVYLKYFNVSTKIKSQGLIFDRVANERTGGLMTADMVKTLRRLDELILTEIDPENYVLPAGTLELALGPGKHEEISMVLVENTLLMPDQYYTSGSGDDIVIHFKFGAQKRDARVVIHFKKIFHTTKENLADDINTNDSKVAASTVLTYQLLKMINKLEERITKLEGGN